MKLNPDDWYLKWWFEKLGSKEYEVDDVWSEELWSWINLSLKNFQVKEDWGWRRLKLKKFEVEKI